MTGTTADAAPPAAHRFARGRGTELGLLVLAVLLPAWGYCAVGLAKTGTLPPGAATCGAGLGASALLAHLVVRRRAPYADPLLLPIAVLLNGIGLVLLHRMDLERSGSDAASAQLLWSAVGVGCCLAVLLLLRDHRALRRHTYPCVAAALALLHAPVFFSPVNGARLWVHLGELSFQPGEFAKILLVVFFAGHLAAGGAPGRRGGRASWPRRPTVRLLGPALAVWLLSVLVLVLERDLGTSLLFFGVFVALLYAATGRLGWIAAGLLLGSAGAVLAGACEPHVHARIADWLHPFASAEAGAGAGQLAQSLFAFGAGGATGTGLGLGHSRLIGFATTSDFVLATAGEELGLAGLVALLLLYALFVERGYRAGLGLADDFGKLLAAGLATTLALQVFVIAGGVTGLIPLTGMPMPFLAQGGSSVVTSWVLTGLLLRLSDTANRRAARAAR